jgi:hypothetical protein
MSYPVNQYNANPSAHHERKLMKREIKPGYMYTGYRHLNWIAYTEIQPFKGRTTARHNAIGSGYKVLPLMNDRDDCEVWNDMAVKKYPD